MLVAISHPSFRVTTTIARYDIINISPLTINAYTKSFNMLRNAVAPLARQAVASTSRAAGFSTVARPTVVAAARATSSSVFGAPVQRRGYHEKVIDHYENPRNVGSFLKTEKNVGIGLVGAPACGDVMKLSIKVNEDGIIEDVRFKTFGCGSAIASSSYMTERVKGLSLDEAAKIKNTEIAQELCLPPVKLHCSMLAEDAIKSAIKNYRSKREATGNKKQGHIEVVQDVATGNTSATAHVGSGTV